MILLVANSSWNLYHYRQPLILALLAEGFQVETAGPKDDFLPALQLLTGSNHHCLERLNPQGQNQLAELACLREITALYKRLQPKLILHFTIKPNLYGGMAARRLGLPYIAVITGLGYTFLHDSLSNRLVPFLYRVGLARAKKVVFYNAADQQEFIQGGVVSKANSCIINGSGVDLDYFLPSPLPGGPVLRCLYVGRLLKDKGLRELVQAVQRLQAKQVNIQLTVLGSPEVLNPEAIGAAELLGSMGSTIATDNNRSPYPLCSADSNPAPALCARTYASEKQNARRNIDTKSREALANECIGTSSSTVGLRSPAADTTIRSARSDNRCADPKTQMGTDLEETNQAYLNSNSPTKHYEAGDQASCFTHPTLLRAAAGDSGLPPLATEDFAAIHFAAPVEDVRPYFASHHLFVLPSYREGLSRAGAEALACGRPLLVSDVPGCRELINEQGSNGNTVAARSVDELEEALLQFCKRAPDTLAQMGKDSRAWAEKQFSAASVSKAFISLIRNYIEP